MDPETFAAVTELAIAKIYQNTYENKVDEAVGYLNDFVREKPEFGVTLGSGLGDLANEIDVSESIDYEQIPNFPVPTTEGHAGKLLIGELERVPIIGLSGRKHYYEVAGQPFNTGILQVVFPIHVLAGLGVPNYLATNATGGLNLNYQTGDLMIINSHISNLVPNPLLGRRMDFERIDGEKVWPFQPMNGAYDPELRALLKQAGSEFRDHIKEGTYVIVTGPTFETEAESVAFRDRWGADAVGMSIAPEVIVATNRGMKSVGLCCITNMITPDGTNATNHDEVQAILNSEKVRNRLSITVRNFFMLYREQNLS